MAAGLIVYNDTDNLVIDSTFANLALFAKGATTTTTAAGDTSYVSFTIPNCPDWPLIAVRSSAGAWAAVRTFSSGNAVVDIVCKGPTRAVVEYWVFARTPNDVPAQYLEVKSETGQMVFNGALKYLRIVGAHQLLPSSNGTDGFTVDYPAGKTYAVFQDGPAASTRVVNQSPVPSQQDWWLYTFRGMLAITGNTFKLVSANFASQRWGPTTPPNYSVAATAYVVDVTGY
jgi:hypothetical protein